MKNLFFIISSLFFVFSNAYGRKTDNQIDFKIEASFLRLEPKKGFHLNAEAPANATFDALEALYQPVQKTEKLFTFLLVGKAKKAKLSFYVCDDKKTVCEQHQPEITLANLKVASASPTPVPKKVGFVVTDTNQHPSDIAKEQLLVSKNDKPTLLIFSAPWCPACIRMQTETYPKKQVSEQLKKVNFVKVNSDLPENYELSEKFRVKAIPTLILLNTDGEETYRWLDFQAAPVFAKALSTEIKKVSLTKGSLEKKALLGDVDAISQLGQISYNTLDCAEAIKWFSMSKKLQDQKFKFAAEISCADAESGQGEKQMTDYLKTLEKAITLTPSTVDQNRWLVDWIEKKIELKQNSDQVKEKAQQLLVKLESRLKNEKQLAVDFKQSTFGETEGFEIAETHLMRSRLFKALGDADSKNLSDQKIRDSLKNKKFSVEKPGEMLIAIFYLRESGEKEKVEKMYADLIRKYPETYVYYEKYARYMLNEKSFQSALDHSDKALAYAEGNQPQLYLLKARILKEMNQPEKMVETIAAANQLKDIQHVRFKKTLAQLNQLKDEKK